MNVKYFYTYKWCHKTPCRCENAPQTECKTKGAAWEHKRAALRAAQTHPRGTNAGSPTPTYTPLTNQHPKEHQGFLNKHGKTPAGEAENS